MKITKVSGREIFDSRGMPTLECELILDNELIVSASVPTGLSRGNYEAYELRDEQKNRLGGKGVLKAIEMLETEISPALKGKEPEVVEMDMHLIELDGTEDKSRLGANTILATSIAVLRAQSLLVETELYELIAYLSDLNTVSIPFPLFNILNGGMHAENSFPIQEIMVAPIGEKSFRASMETITTIFYCLKQVLKKHGKSTALGDEGGFAAQFSDVQEALDLVMEAIARAGKGYEDTCVIALDCAASSWYDTKKKIYQWQDRRMTNEQLCELYASLAQNYPLHLIEDPFAQDDWDGWGALTEKLGDSVKIAGDDIFATNPHRISSAIEKGIANAAIIKPNQIGTVTETLQAINLCKEYEYAVVVSHRSGETNDSFIADLAVGTSSGYFKAGGCTGGERLAKYNRLLHIEDELMLALLD
jgi:enolase